MIPSNCRLYRMYKRAPKALDAMNGVHLPPERQIPNLSLVLFTIHHRIAIGTALSKQRRRRTVFLQCGLGHDRCSLSTWSL